MVRVLLAAVLLLNAALPAMSPANAAPVDASQSQHAGHDMPGMPDMPEHPSTDCCDDGRMDCPCGCVVSQPGAAQFLATSRTHAGAPASAVVMMSRHPFNPVTSPFRPPA